MPINQDKTETTPKTATPTSTQDKPSAGMDASENKPGAPTNAPGRMEINKSGKQPDAARTPDANKQADSDRDQKFGKSSDSPNKGI
jgi:hypothetical protein